MKDSTADFASGARMDTVPNYWDGRIDEAGLWKRVLSASEGMCLHNSGAGCQYPFGSCPAAVSALGARQTWRRTIMRVGGGSRCAKVVRAACQST